jgi:spermidine synthase
MEVAPSVSLVFQNVREIERLNSLYQDIAVLDHSYFGRILVIDGVIQLTFKDEHIYHESLVHPTACCLKNLSNALVIGGGDGGIARELLKYPDCEITVVDLDPVVTQIVDKYIPTVANGAFASPRVNLINANAIDYLANCDTKFDLIIADLTDPRPGTSKLLYEYAFFLQLSTFLNHSGAFVTHLSLPDVGMARFRRTIKDLKMVFSELGCFSVSMPSFGITPMAIAVASQQPLQSDNITAQRISNDTKFFSPDQKPPFVFPRHWYDFLVRRPRF